MRRPHTPQQPAVNATALEQGQLTLAAAFARAPTNVPVQSAPSAPRSSNTAPSAAIACDIPDPPAPQREENAEQQPAPMHVVGQCPGDKRKRQGVLAAEAEAVAELDEADKKTHCTAVEQTAMEVQQLGTPLQPIGIGVAYEPFLPQSRQQPLEALESTDEQHARDRISIEAQHQKPCPY